MLSSAALDLWRTSTHLAEPISREVTSWLASNKHNIKAININNNHPVYFLHSYCFCKPSLNFGKCAVFACLRKSPNVREPAGLFLKQVPAEYFHKNKALNARESRRIWSKATSYSYTALCMCSVSVYMPLTNLWHCTFFKAKISNFHCLSVKAEGKEAQPLQFCLRLVNINHNPVPGM